MDEKNAIIERMNRRDVERVDKLQKSHKAKVDVQSTDEQAEYFAGIFQEKYSSIQKLLDLIPTLYPDMLPEQFIVLKKEINELQKYVVSSSLFLKEFNMRKYLGIIQDLLTQCYDLEEKYVPRKKFGFSRKKAVKVEVPRPENPESGDRPDGPRDTVSFKIDENFFGFDTRKNEILHLSNDELYQCDVTLRNLKNCTISLKGAMGTLHASNLTDCTILCGPVNTSVFIDNCKNCKLAVLCQQLRMHSSKNIDVYLYITSKGIIEDCSSIRTAPYTLAYEGLDNHLAQSSLELKVNNWDNLGDFNWLSTDSPSPNWSVMDNSDRITDWTAIWTNLPSEIL